jgi:hypothetical protein
VAQRAGKIVVTGVRYVRPDRDPWAQRIAALAWPAMIVVSIILWQRWLERVLPRLLAKSGQNEHLPDPRLG